MTYDTEPDDPLRDPYGPRPLDLPAPVPLGPDADLGVLDEAKILAGPLDGADREEWRAALHRWRREARARIGYDGARYDDPATAWGSTAWNVAIVWLWDEALRDWEARRFDVERLLSAYDGFGGLDAVVLWHAYPLIGVDPRNQFDWYDVPGLEQLVADLHARGVRVLLDYNPWDLGTTRTERTDARRLADLVQRLGADGVFLDTLKEGDPELLGALGGLRPHVVLEGESRVPLARIADHQASWAQWFAESPTPGVLRAHWFERRHMMHHTRRWDRDHGEELRSAWLNGVGVLIWDVVFGVRVDWSERDRATLRAMRAAYGEHERLLLDGEWEPLTELAPEATVAGLVASRWELDGTALHTVVNPTSRRYAGPLLPGVTGVVPAGGAAGLLRAPDGSVTVLPITPDLPATPAEPPAPVRRVPDRAPGRPPAGAVRPAPGPRTLRVTWRQRETGLYETAPYVGDWKPLPPRLHQVREEDRRVTLTPVAVDPREVTNSEFAAFLDATGYTPAEPDRFLAHWRDGRPVPGTEGEPVRYVDLDDARAYAGWRGARLPTEDEWQAAAAEPGWSRGGPLVWEWTESEHRDGRTRWVILKGGSWFAAEGSEWYLDGGPRDPEWAVRFLLAQGGLSRSECVGFRCTVDEAPAPPSGRIERATAWSPTLGEDLDLRVYLPPGYGDDPVARYPVLYLLHGRGHDAGDWRRVAPALDDLVRRGVVPPVLAVMPSAPWSAGASWYVDSAYAGDPPGRPVETALTVDLIAHVDATYPTLADREHRIIGGYSMGGAGALRYLLAHPDLFSAGLVMSPAVYDPTPPLDSTTRRHGAFGRELVPFDAEVYTARNYPALLERFDAALPVRLFLAAGDDETARPMPDDYRHDLDLETAVVHGRAKRAPGITTSFRVLAGGHDWSLWTRALVEGLPFLMPGDVTDQEGDS